MARYIYVGGAHDGWVVANKMVEMVIRVGSSSNISITSVIIRRGKCVKGKCVSGRQSRNTVMRWELGV